VSKKAQEPLLWEGCRSIDLPIAIFRYGTVYGEGQSMDRPYSKIAHQLIHGHSATIHEDGNQSRDYIYAGDAVRAPLLWLRSDQRSNIFNVGSGNLTTIAHFVSQLRRAIGHYAGVAQVDPIVDYQVMPSEPRRLSLDCSKARLLGMQASTEMNEGIQRFSSWFVTEHCPEPRKVMDRKCDHTATTDLSEDRRIDNRSGSLLPT
jgi:dTDP-L-rhamnose 4-epimerase